MNVSRSLTHSVASPCDQSNPLKSVPARRAAQLLFLCSAILLLFVNGAYAGDGGYRRTKDGKTLVWDNYPTSGERAEWLGKRDGDGYATGYGTLVWYKPKRTIFTVAERHEVVLAGRFSGKMVRGKLEGRVDSVDASGKTTHATFVSGNKTGDWVAGPAPSPKRTSTALDHPPLQSSSESVREQSGAKGERDETADRAAKAKAPADGSPPVLRQPDRENVSSPAKETPAAVTDSPSSIAAPPSSLNLLRDASPPPSMPTASPSVTGPRLTTPDVIQLADAEARVSGHVLREYHNPQAQYIEATDTWLVSYDQKPVDGAHEGSKHFNVIVEDKTKKTSIATGR